MFFKNKGQLQRFKDAQEHDFEMALSEIRNGRKDGHWIWYIFPQIRGLGMSDFSYHYGIMDMNEAKAYLKDSYLRNHLITITEALLELPETDIRNIVGSPDNLKIRSCMTLFYHVANGHEKSLFKAVIDKYYDGKFDKKTEQILFDK